MKKKAAFASEADLCRAFLSAVPRNWIAYPETAGFDILLSRDDDGFQIGVEAKLKLNATVLSQITECRYRDDGPDCRAILVPAGAAGSVGAIASRLALTVLVAYDPEEARWRWGSMFSPQLPSETERYHNEHWVELCPIRRCQLPEYVPDVEAGMPAPVRLTDWKVKAIKIAILLEQRGFVTRAEFKALHIDVRRWLDDRWLVASEAGLVAGPYMPLFSRQHPSVYEQIRADVSKWLPKVESAAQLVLKGVA